MRRLPLVLLAAAAAAAAVLWLLLGRTAPDAVDVTAPVAALPGASDPGGPTTTVGDPSGEWRVRTDLVPFDTAEGQGSWVGYRVDEVLTTVGDFTAVGRTPEVSGVVRIEGDQVTVASITADLGALRSDSGLRDGQVRRILADRPAVFELAGVLTVPGIPAPGATEPVTAPGRLRIGEIEQEVVFQLAVSLDGDVLVIRGTTEVLLADFRVAVPGVPIVVSVADVATVELQLLLTRE